MDDTTIISYSRAKDQSLLSLAESRSSYMLPFGGRFRVVDFTIHNAVSSAARKTIIYSDCEDDLENYVNRYGITGDPQFPSLKVVTREFSDIGFCYNLIMDTNTAYYIIFNGDNPSIIDFSKIIQKFKKSKSRAVLFKLKISKVASMAHTVLVTNQKFLLDTIKSSMKENHVSPNIFEMIINIMINKNIKKDTIDAHYWSMNTVPDYYKINMEILKNNSLSSVIYHNSSIKSFITANGETSIEAGAKVANSIISDRCRISGTVMNSILFPGVVIGENTIVKDSIILPNIIIGSNSTIVKTIIDEKTDFNTDPEDSQPYLNIGNKCNIGSTDAQMKNSDFSSLNNSLTLIGKNCRIPDDSGVGGACYIASEKGGEYFSKNKYLYNGLSILN